MRARGCKPNRTSSKPSSAAASTTNTPISSSNCTSWASVESTSVSGMATAR